MPVLRRLKIAAVSVLLAVFAMAMVGGMVLPLIGVPLTPTPTLTVTPSGIAETMIALVLAVLIYRDIVRRERRGV
ncbi:MAG: hypothetical protein HY262_12720 [Chloroflexi bacterium]|nr:hypothetical protein [Chloroflexota bacterium]